MKIAIIGTGIAGNVVAHRLRDEHEITVFESAGYVGGHSNTVDVLCEGQELAVDTGFIVFNDRTYPNFCRLLEDIGQPSRDSRMSFSVQADGGRIEYAGSSVSSLFVQRRNLFRPAFLGMLKDILRFNRLASRDASADPVAAMPGPTIGEYLGQHRFGQAFTDHYLVPMSAAIWSASPEKVLDMPAHFLIRFFANHGLVQLRNRPQWKVIAGGSREYVARLTEGHRDRIRLNSPVRSLRRKGNTVEIGAGTGIRESFDCVFVACHADHALAMLEDPSDRERQILGAFRFQDNDAVLHTDVSLLPTRKKAWAAWNYHAPADSSHRVSVTYNMNILQSLPTDVQHLVTLNPAKDISPEHVIRRMRYDHPVLDTAAVAAQARHAEVNCDRTFYCGAYWRNGFHEDGVVSALAALGHFKTRALNEQPYLRRAG